MTDRERELESELQTFQLILGTMRRDLRDALVARDSARAERDALRDQLAHLRLCPMCPALTRDP